MPLTTTAPAPARAPAPTAAPPALRRWTPALAIALLSILYFVSASLHAASQKLWFDEILTFDAASLLPSLPALWTFLKQGFESNPPLGFLITAASETVFGRNEFGLRFPSIVEFWIMALCLYVFLRRRFPWPYALAGMLLPALMPAGRYAYEARPYALVMALAGIALVAWQSAAAGRHRRIALVSIAVALAAALCSQPLAVTLALPFAAGEIARTLARKRVDWPIWCAFAASAPALVVVWLLKNAAHKTAYSRFAGTVPGHIFTSYIEILRPVAVVLAVAFFLVALLRRQDSVSDPHPPRAASGMPKYELAALAGFALIPFAAVPISILGGHYWLRYSLDSTIGLAGLAAAALCALAGNSRVCAAATLAVTIAGFAAAQFLPATLHPDGGTITANSSAEVQPFLEKIPSDAPIAIGPGMTFIELEHYASPPLAARLYYLTAPAANAAIDGEFSFEVKAPLLPRFFPFRAHIADYYAFIAAHKRFYVVRPIRNLAREAVAGRLQLQPRETPDHFQYYEATAP